MRFAFTDDQLAFRDAVRDLLTKRAGPDAVRAAWDGDRPATTRTVWAHLAEMGVLGPPGPGGRRRARPDEVDLVLILEEAGGRPCPGRWSNTSPSPSPP